jgi:hypothetical protein
MEMEQINEAIRFLRGRPPLFTADADREAREQDLKYAMKQLISIKNEMDRLRELGESETSIHHSYSNMYIQALEKVIMIKKQLKMLEMGTIEELTRRKIKILEDQCEF